MSSNGRKENELTVRILEALPIRHVEKELAKIRGLEISCADFAAQLELYIIRLDGLAAGQATLFSNTAAKYGCLIPKNTAETSSLIFAASKKQLGSMTEKTPDDLRTTCRAIENAIINFERRKFSIPYPGGRLDIAGKAAVMGIVNVTPDSFSDGGDNLSIDSATSSAFKMIEAGAAIIDIGGESTRPGSKPVSIDEELSRVIPVIEKISSETEIPVSIDTHKPEVAKEALKAGAKIINDITGLRNGTAMAEIAAESGVPVILMHMKGAPKTMQDNPVYGDLIHDIYSSLAGSIEKAEAFGIARNMLIVDPGIGFGKTFEDNLMILERLHEFKSLGVAICVGASRKAFIGAVLGLKNPKERLVGSLSAALIAAVKGAKILRVHDVKETVEALRLAEAVASGGFEKES